MTNYRVTSAGDRRVTSSGDPRIWTNGDDLAVDMALGVELAGEVIRVGSLSMDMALSVAMDGSPVRQGALSIDLDLRIHMATPDFQGLAPNSPVIAAHALLRREVPLRGRVVRPL